MRQQSTQPLLEEVRADRLGLAVGLCAHAPGGDLCVQRLKDEPVLLAVPAGHRLARRRRVRVAELAGEEFALDDPGEGPGYNAAVLAVCAGAGFAPRARELASHHDAWQNAVLHDGCIGLTVRSAIHSGHQGLRLVALDPPATFPLDLLWRRGAHARSPALAAVLATAADVARQEHWVAAAS